MDDFNKRMNDVKFLISNALESEGSSQNKLEIYRKYIKSLSALFNGLDKDLDNYPSDFDDNSISIVRQKHVSMLQSANNCVTRCMDHLQYSSGSKRSDHSLSTCSSFERRHTTLQPDLRSLPGKKSIDILLSEKPLNPIDSAKFNIQKVINNTNKLLQSEKLSSSQRISVQLKLSRMIEETLSIAKKREESICRVKTNDLEQLQERIDYDISRFSVLKVDLELAQLYKSSLLFYHHILKGSKWYELAQLDRCPESSCLTFILRINDNHPILIHIDNIISSLLSNKMEKESIDSVDTEIKKFTEKIQKLAMACCLIGNITSQERNYNASQTLFNLLCEFIFNKPSLIKFIYDFLFISGEDSMNQYNDNVQLTQETKLDSALFPEKFQRYSSIKDIIDKKISELSSLRNIYNPLDRMSKLTEIIRNMTYLITEKNPKVEIGADELVPILSYMMIKFDSAEIFLHIKYLELLTPSDYLMGIDGYILVSVCCAITFCTSDKFQGYLTTNHS